MERCHVGLMSSEKSSAKTTRGSGVEGILVGTAGMEAGEVEKKTGIGTIRASLESEARKRENFRRSEEKEHQLLTAVVESRLLTETGRRKARLSSITIRVGNAGEGDIGRETAASVLSAVAPNT